MTEAIKLTIDGVEVEAKPGQTVLQAAIDNNVYIPYLCYWPGMKPYGACRMCCVEVEGGRGTPASCTLPVAEGMVVNTLGQEIRGLRESVLELLLSEHPHGLPDVPPHRAVRAAGHLPSPRSRHGPLRGLPQERAVRAQGHRALC